MQWRGATEGNGFNDRLLQSILQLNNLKMSGDKMKTQITNLEANHTLQPLHPPPHRRTKTLPKHHIHPSKPINNNHLLGLFQNSNAKCQRYRHNSLLLAILTFPFTIFLPHSLAPIRATPYILTSFADAGVGTGVPAPAQIKGVEHGAESVLSGGERGS